MDVNQYLKIRDDHTQDPNPVYYFYWQLKGSLSLSSDQFFHAFWTWVHFILGSHNFGRVQYHVFNELDKHFKLKS